MKITIPENKDDITLEQYQKYSKIIDDKELSEIELTNNAISVFCNIPLDQVENISKSDYDFISNSINFALSSEGEFKNVFTIDGIEYGFMTSLNNDDISTKEFIDLQLYPIDNIETLNKLMAILFRKVVSKDGFGSYEIEPYNGTKERAEIFKKMPLSVLKGAISFFLNLHNELLQASQKYIQAEQVRV